jgi:hypothetical protein
MLNGQRQNDYTAIAPTSLLVAGVRALAPGCGRLRISQTSGIGSTRPPAQRPTNGQPGPEPTSKTF